MNIGIIGGGAAGIMAALTATKMGANVTILEHMPRIGKKILLTGSGKCNITNADMVIDHFYGTDLDIISSVLKECPKETTLSFLYDLGLVTKEKNGYYYPFSEQASTVLDCLRFALRDYGVNVITDTHISRISKKDKFIIETSGGKFDFDKVILCCGSKAYKNTGSDGSGYELAKSFGHSIIKPVSSLTYLVCKEKFFASIAGIRTNGTVSLFGNGKILASRKGQIQLTKTGISGIPVFDLSFMAARSLEKGFDTYAEIDFLDEFTEDELEKLLISRAKTFPNRHFEELFTGILHKNLGLLILKNTKVDINLELSILLSNKGKNILKDIIKNTKYFKTYIDRTGDFDNAQVCAGGVSLKEVNNKLESKLVKGLYFAGEILDVNGDCGGYNLQWAFSSGAVAAKGCLS